MSEQTIIAIIGVIGVIVGGIITSIPALLAIRSQRKKDDAERKAQQAQAEIEQRNTLKTFEKQLLEQAWKMNQDVIESLQEEVASLKTDRQKDREKIENLSVKLNDALSKIAIQGNEIDKYKRELSEYERELTAYRLGVLILISQLKEMRVMPKWEPDHNSTDSHF